MTEAEHRAAVKRLYKMDEMSAAVRRAWSPLLRDKIVGLWVRESDERTHYSDEDVARILGFDPFDIENLKPPWRNPAT